ncbi:hypothetical protein OK074_8482 [Actinobacteria bacterium OK074]|nr:hypothetical protein OK074_8482 [Actinobacteria bacterium OK074]
MNPLSLSAGVWWAIAAVTVAFYLTVVVRWMPTPATRTQISMAPVLGAFFLLVCLAKGMPLSEGLGMVVGGLLGIPLSLVGQRRELAKRILEWEANGSRRGELHAPTMLSVRLIVTLPAMVFLGLWLG